MPHPIYGKPTHGLETVAITVTLPDPQNGHVTSLSMRGESSGQRASLWSFREDWGPDDIVNGLQCSDLVAHALLAVLQDRPNSQERVESTLLGEGWEDVPLPF